MMNLNPFNLGVKSKVDKKLVSIVPTPRPTPLPAPQPNITSKVYYTSSSMDMYDLYLLRAEIKREERQEKLKSIFDEEELK